MAAENSNNNNASSSSSSNTASSSGAGRSSNATADSYIGSLISLTSKSEIRYEGVLYNINTDESSIGLKNVRSFGTEGRKKDGPQIPPSERVYEYILFRGSDIKDLQVKSSPPVQPTPPINNDPAIIHSHYPRPVSTPTSSPPTGIVPLGDAGSHNNQLGLPASTFQGGLPLYQPGGSLGTWGASPAPSANGSGLAMPMYWPGYYGPLNGLPPLHQQSLLRPPPGLSIPPSMQQPMQYPNFNTPLSMGASSLTGSNMPSTVSDVAPPLNNASATSLNLASTSSASSTLPPPLAPLLYFVSTSSASSALPPLTSVPSATITASENLPSLMPNKVPSTALSATHLTPILPSVSPVSISTLELTAIVPPISNKPNVVSGPTIPYQGSAQSTCSVGMATTSLRSEAPTPSLVTPGQLLQSAPSSVQPVQVPHKDVEVVQVSSSSQPSPEPSIPVPTEALPPILPLPVPLHAAHKPNGPPFNNQRQGYRGSGRGRGRGIVSSRPLTKFTEDFDFEAMNEKFNKNEVWGHLGKSNKSHSMDKGGASGEDDSQDEYDDEIAKIEIKSVYKKDDFFDTLSCDTRDRDPQNGRARFSEQMKLDTETFGDFSRYRGGRGGRGPHRGGRSRGSYYGRDYGYGGYGSRGRGRGHAY